MISQVELSEGIASCLIGEPTPEKMVRLASYYIVQDRLFPREESVEAPQKRQSQDLDAGGSEFLDALAGKSIADVLPVLDELMEAVGVYMPKLYDMAMQKIRSA